MVGWILFIGLLGINVGFFFGCVYAGNKKESKNKEQSFGEFKPISKEEKEKEEKEKRKQKHLEDDIAFLNNFTGEEE